MLTGISDKGNDMDSAPPFQPFPKIGRLRRDIIVTEKIDGTNASVFVPEDDDPLIAGSRNRWIYPEADNFGFAAWVRDNGDDLRLLGPGMHFGEWWGAGIQRRYDQDHKRFSLFNVDRWGADRPDCCDVVPVLARHGEFASEIVSDAMADLQAHGSCAAPGFMRPEGVVVFHPQSRQSFKLTFEKDEAGKGRDQVAP